MKYFTIHFMARFPVLVCLFYKILNYIKHIDFCTVCLLSLFFPCLPSHTTILIHPNLITQCPVSYCLIRQWPHHRHWQYNLFSIPTGQQMALHPVLIKKKPPPSNILKNTVVSIHLPFLLSKCTIHAKYK